MRPKYLVYGNTIVITAAVAFAFVRRICFAFDCHFYFDFLVLGK